MQRLIKVKTENGEFAANPVDIAWVKTYEMHAGEWYTEIGFHNMMNTAAIRGNFFNEFTKPTRRTRIWMKIRKLLSLR